MPHLGNAWHIPGESEPRGRGGMRDPAGALVPGMEVTIYSGNQFQGFGGDPGNQWQIGSSVFFKRAADGQWTELPLIFHSEEGNNKFYSATIPTQTSSAFQVGDVVQYYLRIAYDDHDTTFLRANGNLSMPTADESAARAAPFTFAVQDSALRGRWGPVLKFRNAAIHAHVLPNRRVLMWGRRDRPTATLDEHVCTPFLWDPADPTNPADPTTAKTIDTPQPKLADGTTGVNLFCSGHAFLPDGRLLVAGGHLADSDGVNQASLYDGGPAPASPGTWTPDALMNKGRWYPTATTLPDGGVLVVAGSYKEHGTTLQNTTPQVWRNGGWTAIAAFPHNKGVLELYPRMHVASDGRVFMSGPLAQTYLLATDNGGQWTEVAHRALGQRDYAPSVMYDVDKVIFIGGGGGHGTPPTAEAEIIDLSQAAPKWDKTHPMKFHRRQHNATLLPDGTVLVTGGTRGGTTDDGFNDLGRGQPVHTAELWNPATGQWAEMAGEVVDRCYHATAVLLPDATVLSAGGGEYRPDHVKPNDPEDTHRDAQIFSPPYLFKGPRPVITADPKAVVTYGEVFDVPTAQPDDIGKVSWIRLASVTHSFDQNQRINFLPFQAGAATLRVTAPASPNVCPPGHYMLFIVSKAGVPSLARIIRIQGAVVPVAVAARTSATRRVETAEQPYADSVARRAAVTSTAKGTPVIVGITGTCPYGIGACWGGAHEALSRLEGVDLVNPIPNAEDSTAEVFLQGQRLPALDRWGEQFRGIVSGRYLLRGVEVTLQGVVQEREGNLVLAGTAERPPVQLAALGAVDKIQWDHKARARRPLDEGEARAYERLAAASRGSQTGRRVTVAGPLTQNGGGYRLHVRLFRNA